MRLKKRQRAEMLDMLQGNTPVPQSPARARDIVTKEQMVALIWLCHGLTPLICAHLGVTENHLLPDIRRWGLEDIMKEARAGIEDEAYKVLLDSLNSKQENNRIRAADIILKQSRPASQQQVVVKTDDSEIAVKTIFGLGD